MNTTRNALSSLCSCSYTFEHDAGNRVSRELVNSHGFPRSRTSPAVKAMALPTVVRSSLLKSRLAKKCLTGTALRRDIRCRRHISPVSLLLFCITLKSFVSGLWFMQSQYQDRDVGARLGSRRSDSVFSTDSGKSALFFYACYPWYTSVINKCRLGF